MTDETALAEPAPGLPEALTRKPIIDLLDPAQVSLLAQRANAGSKSDVTRSELGAFLELAASYQLDPFAGEVWLTKGKNDKVLIMVGRDGLRKIAQRNGLYVDGDVIRQEDDFQTRRNADGTREVMHVYGHPAGRGPIVAAWCEVRNEAGTVVGFFVANVEEYKPTSGDVLRYSPWGSQESVMILAAAERQALRQATPLSGLVAQGELDRAQEAEAAIPLDEAGPLHEDPDIATRAEEVVARAAAIGHAGLSNRGAAAMALRGQPVEVAQAWIDAGWDTLSEADEAAADAEVVGGDDGPESEDERDAMNTAAAGGGDATQGALAVDA